MAEARQRVGRRAVAQLGDGGRGAQAARGLRGDELEQLDPLGGGLQLAGIGHEQRAELLAARAQRDGDDRPRAAGPQRRERRRERAKAALAGSRPRCACGDSVGQLQQRRRFELHQLVCQRAGRAARERRGIPLAAQQQRRLHLREVECGDERRALDAGGVLEARDSRGVLREAPRCGLRRDAAEALEALTQRERRLPGLLLVGDVERACRADLEYAADHAPGDDRHADDRRAVRPGVALLGGRTQRPAGRAHRDRDAVAHVRQTGVCDGAQPPGTRHVCARAEPATRRDCLARRFACGGQIGTASKHGCDRRSLHHWQGIGASGQGL